MAARKPKTAQKAPEPNIIDSDALTAGYVVGVTKDGDLLFQPLGSNPGMVELMGLHQFAAINITKIIDKQNTLGDALVHEVGKAVHVLHGKVDQLMAKILPDTKAK